MKITTDPALIDFVNEHVVPITGTRNHDVMRPHAPLPDGRCWIYPTMTCEQHRLNFMWGLYAMTWFPMSPGHAILSPRVGPAPSRDEFVLVGDEQLPDEGTVDSWIAEFKKQQAKVGAGIAFSDYERQRAEFDHADGDTLRRIAANDKAAFREDARAALEPDAKAHDKVADLLRDGRNADALALLGDARGLRATQLRRQIERAAWHLLSQARICAHEHDAARAGHLYQTVVDEYAGTDAERAARKEMK